MIQFPIFSGIRCLMMPYIQGNPASIPSEYSPYFDIIRTVFINPGDIGFLTIDESFVEIGKAQRAARAKFGRALHTEAGKRPGGLYAWGDTGWGSSHRVTLDRSTKILLANSVDDSCAVWNVEREDTSIDGDIGDKSGQYPYETAKLLKAGEVCEIGILTPHESLPINKSTCRQFLRIIGSGVHGREPYFTINPLMKT